jgi:hypothetical protein
VLLWIRTGRRKAEIKDLKGAVRRLKKSKNASVKKNTLRGMRDEWNGMVEDLWDRINVLQSRVRKLKRRVNELESSGGHSSKGTKSKKDSGTNSIGFEELDSGFGSDHERKDRSDHQTRKTGRKSMPKRLKADYNRILSDDLGRREFQSRYEPVALGIKNEKERLDREDAPVLLKKDERGQYLSIETNSGHFVVPDPEVTLDDPARRQAGYDEVFQCGQSPHNHPYVVQRLRKVAQFVKRTDGTYSLRDPGQIDLKRYD